MPTGAFHTVAVLAVLFGALALTRYHFQHESEISLNTTITLNDRNMAGNFEVQKSVHAQPQPSNTDDGARSAADKAGSGDGEGSGAVGEVARFADAAGRSVDPGIEDVYVPLVPMTSPADDSHASSDRGERREASGHYLFSKQYQQGCEGCPGCFPALGVGLGAGVDVGAANPPYCPYPSVNSKKSLPLLNPLVAHRLWARSGAEGNVSSSDEGRKDSDMPPPSFLHICRNFQQPFHSHALARCAPRKHKARSKSGKPKVRREMELEDPVEISGDLIQAKARHAADMAGRLQAGDHDESALLMGAVKEEAVEGAMGDGGRAEQRTRRKSKRAVAEGDEWAVEGGGPNAIQQIDHSLGLHRSETTDTSADPIAVDGRVEGQEQHTAASRDTLILKSASSFEVQMSVHAQPQPSNADDGSRSAADKAGAGDGEGSGAAGEVARFADAAGRSVDPGIEDVYVPLVPMTSPADDSHANTDRGERREASGAKSMSWLERHFGTYFGPSRISLKRAVERAKRWAKEEIVVFTPPPAAAAVTDQTADHSHLADIEATAGNNKRARAEGEAAEPAKKAKGEPPAAAAQHLLAALLQHRLHSHLS
ncbi:unnamed protein product [Vitrella brassicaformis CCMP3155]|uniref:Uncharacterized protein n=1 Tax=Vitrella brassicaformis (strain CCMP3155) TaxID=1169540 RepID=A0A0G4F6V9_VITBC|nr:unnamed protein product [Vitrella brassicaformis CCMP3155]|eukprot:CEM07753.1 unnamed protein product [Vitrella brassicaformis CCMP3155]